MDNHIKKVLLLFILYLVLFTSFGCNCKLTDLIDLDKNRNKFFLEVKEIGNNPNYATLDCTAYYSNEKEIVFRKIIQDRLKEDVGFRGEIDEYDISFTDYDDFIYFYYRYKKKKNFFGLNNENNYYAVGTISTIDFNISIQYFNCEYERAYNSMCTNTHYEFVFLDLNKVDDKGMNIKGYMSIDRNTGEIKKWESFDEMQNNIGNQLNKYVNPTSFVENGIEYNLFQTTVYNDELKVYINCPKITTIIDKNKELEKIVKLLGGTQECDYIEGCFITNGDELFLCYYTQYNAISVLSERKLLFPVILKTDINFENIEYVGCFDYTGQQFHQELRITKVIK